MQILDCYRIVTFVPEKHLEAVINALRKSNLLNYGNYKDVLWFSASGTGQFTPVENAKPVLGEVGKLERCEEVRLEFSILRDDINLQNLIENVLMPAHPWEEPVIVITEVRETRSGTSGQVIVEQDIKIHRLVMILLGVMVVISVLIVIAGISATKGVVSFIPHGEFINTEGAGSIKPLPDFMIDNLKPDELEQLKP